MYPASAATETKAPITLSYFPAGIPALILVGVVGSHVHQLFSQRGERGSDWLRLQPTPPCPISDFKIEKFLFYKKNQAINDRIKRDRFGAVTTTVPEPMAPFLCAAPHCPFRTVLQWARMWRVGHCLRGALLCPPPSPAGLRPRTLMYSLVSGLTRDPEIGPRWSKPAGGAIDKPATSESLLGRTASLCIPCSVELLSPCLIQRLESIQSQSEEQKKKPLVKVVFSGVCT